MCNQLDRPNVCGSVARRVYAEGLFPFFCLFPRRVKWVAVGSVSARFIHIAGAVWLNYNNNTCSSLAWPYLLSMRASVVVSAHNSRPCLVSWARVSLSFHLVPLSHIAIHSHLICNFRLHATNELPLTRARARVRCALELEHYAHSRERWNTTKKKPHTTNNYSSLDALMLNCTRTQMLDHTPICAMHGVCI